MSEQLAARYRRFAAVEAHGRSPIYEALAPGVAADAFALEFLATLPDEKRQPNLLFAAILAVFILAFATAPKARAQDNGHHLHHADHYSKWKQPGTDTSCCNGRETKDGQTTGDCYPTTAEVRAGSWWAKTDDGRWVIVPEDRIIRERNPDVERTHLCFNYDRVLCFVPPNTGT